MNFDSNNEGREDNPEENLVFHYNREERVKKAPKIVQDYYSGELKAFKPGLLKALTATKGNRMILFALVICFMVVILNGIFNKPNEASAEGIPMNLSCFSYEDTVYVSVRLSAPEKRYKRIGDQPVEATVLFLDKEKNTIASQNITDIYEGKETYVRTTFNQYDIFYVRAEMKLLEKEYSLFTAVERR